MISIFLIIIILFGLYILRRNHILYKDKEKLCEKRFFRKGNPLVSVIIPARNEEHGIERCVNSILNQSYKNVEVIIVDDQSTDGTSEIAERLASENKKVKVLTIDCLPADWTGKCNASFRAAKKAKGEWFLFTDADTWHKDTSISSALNYVCDNNVDLLSLWSRHRSDLLLIKIILHYMEYMNRWVADFPSELNSPENEKTAAFGTYIFINANKYRKFGGYGNKDVRTVGSSTDLAIARAARKAGLSIKVLAGYHLCEVEHLRSYSQARDSMAKVICKNYPLILIAGILFAGFSLNVFPLIVIIYSIISLNALNLYLAACAYAVSMMPWWYTKISFSKNNFFYAFSYPFGFFIFTFIVFYSFKSVYINKSIPWKGRQFAYRKLKDKKNSEKK
ncbi:MAG: glycosyltransferase family 2 protein [Elusimicrobiota bacterium]